MIIHNYHIHIALMINMQFQLLHSSVLCDVLNMLDMHVTCCNLKLHNSVTPLTWGVLCMTSF